MYLSSSDHSQEQAHKVIKHLNHCLHGAQSNGKKDKAENHKKGKKMKKLLCIFFILNTLYSFASQQQGWTAKYELELKKKAGSLTLADYRGMAILEQLHNLNTNMKKIGKKVSKCCTTLQRMNQRQKPNPEHSSDPESPDSPISRTTSSQSENEFLSSKKATASTEQADKKNSNEMDVTRECKYCKIQYHTIPSDRNYLERACSNCARPRGSDL